MSARRKAYVAGQFYPETESECRRELEAYTKARIDEYEGTPVAGIVPHAGWVFSGATAGKVFSFFKQFATPKTFILFGAVHRYMSDSPAVMADGAWETPLGDVEIDASMASELLGACAGLTSNARAHDGEHSIEVQVPFIKFLFPEAKIVPILAPPTGDAAALGDAVGRAIAGRDDVIAIGSTDLTHYGFEYGFAPKGAGEEALKWAREVNDRRMIDIAIEMKAEEAVPVAQTHHNACGSGAVAAATAVAHAKGKKKGILLDYTTSYDVMPRGRPSMFVGYAGIVF
ncbi:MAG: AmmeMemoRadiSam system protein B [bacterium]